MSSYFGDDGITSESCTQIGAPLFLQGQEGSALDVLCPACFWKIPHPAG